MEKYKVLTHTEILRRIEIAQIEIEMVKLPVCLRTAKLSILASMSLRKQKASVPVICHSCYHDLHDLYESKEGVSCNSMHLIDGKLVDIELENYIFGINK